MVADICLGDGQFGGCLRGAIESEQKRVPELLVSKGKCGPNSREILLSAQGLSGKPWVEQEGLYSLAGTPGTAFASCLCSSGPQFPRLHNRPDKNRTCPTQSL